MLRSRPLFSRHGVSVTVYECDGDHAGWSEEEGADEFRVVLVQRGSFRRRVDGVEALVHPLAAYAEHAGESHRVAHPSGGDVCTDVGVSIGAMGSLLDPERPVPGAVFHIEPSTDLAHRMLLRRIQQGADPDELVERAVMLAGRVMRGDAPVFRRRCADMAREALSANPELRLPQLASMTGVSMYELSRTFHKVVGCTVSGYRLRLRTHAAMERIAAGETNLARLAADVGFADQSHLTRTLVRQLHITPRRLRDVLAGA